MDPSALVWSNSGYVEKKAWQEKGTHSPDLNLQTTVSVTLYNNPSVSPCETNPFFYLIFNIVQIFRYEVEDGKNPMLIFVSQDMVIKGLPLPRVLKTGLNKSRPKIQVHVIAFFLYFSSE